MFKVNLGIVRNPTTLDTHTISPRIFPISDKIAKQRRKSRDRDQTSMIRQWIFRIRHDLARSRIPVHSLRSFFSLSMCQRSIRYAIERDTGREGETRAKRGRERERGVRWHECFVGHRFDTVFTSFREFARRSRSTTRLRRIIEIPRADPARNINPRYRPPVVNPAISGHSVKFECF